MAVKEWLLAHWRWLAVAAGLVGAFAVGRWTRAPPEVREVERVEYRTRVVTVTRVVTERAQTKVVVRDRLVEKDGTTHEHEVEREATQERSQTGSSTATDSEGRTDRSRLTTARPAWHGGISGGASLQVATLTFSPDVGLHLEHRVFDSPFFGGLQVGSRPTLSEVSLKLSLSLEF